MKHLIVLSVLFLAGCAASVNPNSGVKPLGELSASFQFAMSRCAPHTTVVADLKRLYSEELYWVGTLDNGSSIVKMFHNPVTKSWTKVMVNTQGVACYWMAGDHSILMEEGEAR